MLLTMKLADDNEKQHAEFRFLRISELIREREQRRMAAHWGGKQTTLSRQTRF